MPDASALLMAEPQVKIMPALSATSDIPEPVETTTEAKSETPPAEKKTVDATGVDATKTDDKTVDATPADGEAKPADETPGWMKAEVTKERNRRREAETRAADAERKATQASSNLARALEGLETLTKAQAAQFTKTAEQQDPQPKRDQFDNPDAYDAALIDWSGRRAAMVARIEADRAINEKQLEAQREHERRTIDQQNREVLDSFTKRKAKFVEDHPDYEELVDQKDDLPISVPMANAILTDDDGPAIAYYLGQNPDEAARISKLPPVRAVAELGRIAARLNVKPAVSTKPAPIRPLKTGSEAATRKSPSEESMEEYGARRQREIFAERRARMGLAN